jgi:hypothetical protein
MRRLLFILALGAIGSALACNAFLDIDGIEFSDGIGGSGGSGGTMSTSAGGAGGDVGAAGGVGGIGGTPPASSEDCSNGVDDNDDGLADCDDPLCVCAEALATSWSGPAVLYRASPGMTPGCPADWPSPVAIGFSGTLDAPPATCSACSCGNASGVTCAPGAVSFYTLANCSGPATNQTPTTSCTAIGGASSGYLSAKAPVPTPTGGSCPASGGQATVAPAEFSEQAVLCEGASAGVCSTGACLPLPPAPYLASICIYKSGNTSCPAPYSEPHDLYQTINDYRDCSACSCGVPSGASCSGSTLTFDGPTNVTCAMPSENVPHDNVCHSVDTPGSMDYMPGNAQGGGCSASGGGLLRVCCLP